MKDQFEVWEYNFPVKGPHPVVLIDVPGGTYQLLLVRLRELGITSPRSSVQQAAASIFGSSGPQPSLPGR